jgi:hypothetical protein
VGLEEAPTNLGTVLMGAKSGEEAEAMRMANEKRVKEIDDDGRKMMQRPRMETHHFHYQHCSTNGDENDTAEEFIILFIYIVCRYNYKCKSQINPVAPWLPLFLMEMLLLVFIHG